MTIDWTPIVQAAVTLAGAIITLAAGYAATVVRARLHSEALAAAVATAGGVAYDALVAATRTGGVDLAAARATALAEGEAALTKLAADQVARLAPGGAAALVQGALGQQLAVDPTVGPVLPVGGP